MPVRFFGLKSVKDLFCLLLLASLAFYLGDLYRSLFAKMHEQDRKKEIPDKRASSHWKNDDAGPELQSLQRESGKIVPKNLKFDHLDRKPEKPEIEEEEPRQPKPNERDTKAKYPVSGDEAANGEQPRQYEAANGEQPRQYEAANGEQPRQDEAANGEQPPRQAEAAQPRKNANHHKFNSGLMNAFGLGGGKFMSQVLCPKRPKYAVQGATNHLQTITNFMEKLGYEQIEESEDDWKFLWAYHSRWNKLEETFRSIRPDQKINKIPGLKSVIYKREFVFSGLVPKHVPRAFQLPRDLDAFLAYKEENREKKFVMKNNNHRGVSMLDDKLVSRWQRRTHKVETSFVQEFVDKAFLVDGHRFDITAYAFVTSVDPLRIHVLEDFLLRFCPAPYDPDSFKDRDTYVTKDHMAELIYNKTSLNKYLLQGYTHKEAFGHYLKTQGHDANRVFQQMEDVLRDVVMQKHQDMIDGIAEYTEESKRSFFQVLRADFILDADLNVYVMEFNGSPFLGSEVMLTTRMPNEYIVFYNVLGLVGLLLDGLEPHPLMQRAYSSSVHSAQVLLQELSVYIDACMSDECLAALDDDGGGDKAALDDDDDDGGGGGNGDVCRRPRCRLCLACLSRDDVRYLREAAFEFHNRHVTRRIYPAPPGDPETAGRLLREMREREAGGGGGGQGGLTRNDVKMHEWFLGKCLRDESWCK